MAELARNDVDEAEVDSALGRLGHGLTRAILMTSLLFSEAERRTCTENDPGILKGMLGWGRCIRALREQLRILGWRREEPNSLPLIVSPDRKVAITVATGDEETGNPDASYASTKYDRKKMLCDWVDPSRQLGIFDDVVEPDAEPEEVPDLWILLVLRTKTHVIAELSRPTSVTKDERLRFGGERIFLNPIPIDQTLPNEDEGDREATEVSVERL